jgi:hypothetical protein
MELWREKIVFDLPSFFLSVWDTKECEKEGMMMMFVRMGGGVVGIMRSWERWERKEAKLSWRNKLFDMQFSQHMSWELEARSSSGGGGSCSRGNIHYVWWLEMKIDVKAGRCMIRLGLQLVNEFKEELVEKKEVRYL